MTKKDVKLKAHEEMIDSMQELIEKLKGEKNILERTLNESITVMLNSLDNDALTAYDLNSVISVTLGNMFWGLKQAGVLDD